VDKEKAKTVSNLFSAAYFEGKYPSRLANVIIWGQMLDGYFAAACSLCRACQTSSFRWPFWWLL